MPIDDVVVARDEERRVRRLAALELVILPRHIGTTELRLTRTQRSGFGRFVRRLDPQALKVFDKRWPGIDDPARRSGQLIRRTTGHRGTLELRHRNARYPFGMLRRGHP